MQNFGSLHLVKQQKYLTQMESLFNFFADDGNGLIGGTDIEYMAQRLNRVCRDLSQWGNKCGLSFSASKTVVILFSKSNIEKKKYENKIMVKIDGVKIPF